ncbi:WD-repeat region-domain-containing protein [Chytridium lagenaria]|nr:WD-repeat region-domain-containing protein [Chytridium lagenaria]
MEPFWDTLTEIDTHCRVLEGADSRHICFRKIALEGNCTAHIVIDPWEPKLFPSITFAGPDKKMEDIFTLYSRNRRKWDHNISIYQNLKVLLPEKILSKSLATMVSIADAICSICAAESETSIKGITCIKCKSFFHMPCLAEWFSMIPVTGIMIQQEERKCPHCSAQFADLL